MKRILYLIIDLCIVYGSIIFAFYILKQMDVLIEFRVNFEAFEIITPFIGILYLILMYAFGLYTINRKEIQEILYTIFLLSLVLATGIMGLCFLVRNGAFSFPRSVVLLSALIYFVLLFVWRTSLLLILRKKQGIKQVLIIGQDCNQLSETIAHDFSRYYCIAHQCREDDPALEEKIKTVDEIFINSDTTAQARREIMPFCIKFQKEVCLIPKYFDLSIKASSYDKIDDIPAFRLSNIELSLEERVVKRGIDILFGFIAFIIALPIGFIIALLVKLDGGPVLYAQERITKGKRRFKILKFRTMIPDAEKISGPILAEENDPRITKIGKFIRMVRLDELPQIINILKGDMSIVGPRPERPFFVEQFENEIPEYFYRFKVKAGLTGLAQIEGKYNTTVENKLRYDLIYINDYSIFRDLLIMLQTVKILFMKESTAGINS